MITYLSVVVDNADVYHADYFGIVRTIPLGGLIRAHSDIENIEKAAIKFIDTLENHNKPK